MSWQEKVYKKSESKPIDCTMHTAMLSVYKQTCQACRKKLPQGQLGLHHIIPRSMGGPDEWDNLILLCHTCHNKIESQIEKYPTRAEIAYAFCKRKPKKKFKFIEEVDEIGTKWQEWVYGGKKNPNLLIE